VKVALVCPPSGKFKLQSDISVARELGMVNKGQYLHPPMGVSYVASVLRESEHLPMIIDAVADGLDNQEVFEKLKKFKPDVIIVQTVTPLYRDTMEEVRLYKENFGYIGVAGPHVTVFPDDALKDGADFVIRGEPEYTIRDLVNNIQDDKVWDGIEGLSFRKDSENIHNKDRDLIKNLDDLPFPARDLLPNEKYILPFTKQKEYTIILTSRGCPNQCVYCGTHIYYGRLYRMRSAKNVVDEIEDVIKTLGINHFSFWDDTFTISKKHVLDICDVIINRGLDVYWYCLSRANTIDQEMVLKMKEAGCYHIQFGFESGSNKILEYMKKGITVDDINKALEITKKAGMEISALFLMGFPTETEEDIRKTIDLAKDPAIDYAQFNIVTPYPGTELYDMVKDTIKTPWESFDSYEVIDMDRQVSQERLIQLMKQAHREFYFRPSRMFYILKSMTPSTIKNKLWTIKKFLEMYVR